jgi:hypothetical protein
MKTPIWLLVGLFACTLSCVGCGKKEPPPPQQQGVTLDLPKLTDAFANATPELQALVGQVTQGVRYGEYASALAALAKLENAPGLTEAQKKIVTEVTAQVKEVASKAPNAPSR